MMSMFILIYYCNMSIDDEPKLNPSAVFIQIDYE